MKIEWIRVFNQLSWLETLANGKAIDAACRDAQGAVEQFIDALENPRPTLGHFKARVMIEEGGERRPFWCGEVERQDCGFAGILEQRDRKQTHLRPGKEVVFDERSITDWMYVERGFLKGGFVYQVLRNVMPEDDRDRFDNCVPFVIVKEPLDGPVQELLAAMGENELQKVREILAGKPALVGESGQAAIGGYTNLVELEEVTPLDYAVELSSVPLFELVMEFKPDVNENDEYGNTLLHRAVGMEDCNLVRRLVERGAQVNAANKCGVTPLMVAASGDDPMLVRCLLDLGADVTVRGELGTVLHDLRNVEVAKVLLEAGAEINAVQTDGDTPLHIVLTNGYIEVALLLLGHGARVDVVNGEGRTPIDNARENLEEKEVRIEKMERLLAVVNDPNEEVDSLFQAIASGEEELVRRALTAHPDFANRRRPAQVKGYDEPFFKITTPLHYAVEHERESIVKLLLQHGADVHAVDEDEEMPIQKMAWYNCIEIGVALGSMTKTQRQSGLS